MNKPNLEEEWRRSPLLPDHYLVSDKGRCINTNTNHVQKQVKDSSGYYMISYIKNGKRTHVKSHRAIATAFINNPDPDNKVFVNHIDGNKTNNNINNLEWVTPKENSQHAINTGLYNEYNCANQTPIIMVKDNKVIGASHTCIKLARNHLHDEPNYKNEYTLARAINEGSRNLNCKYYKAKEFKGVNDNKIKKVAGVYLETHQIEPFYSEYMREMNNEKTN